MYTILYIVIKYTNRGTNTKIYQKKGGLFKMFAPEMQLAFWMGVLIPVVVLAVLYILFKVSIKYVSLAIIVLGAIILYASTWFGFTGAVYGAVAVGMILIGIVTLIVGLFDEIRILKKRIKNDEERTY